MLWKVYSLDTLVISFTTPLSLSTNEYHTTEENFFIFRFSVLVRKERQPTAETKNSSRLETLIYNFQSNARGILIGKMSPDFLCNIISTFKSLFTNEFVYKNTALTQQPFSNKNILFFLENMHCFDDKKRCTESHVFCLQFLSELNVCCIWCRELRS